MYISKPESCLVKLMWVVLLGFKTLTERLLKHYCGMTFVCVTLLNGVHVFKQGFYSPSALITIIVIVFIVHCNAWKSCLSTLNAVWNMSV